MKKHNFLKKGFFASANPPGAERIQAI